MSKVGGEYLKSIIFGIEDSLVSTTGLVAGISVGSQSKQTVLLAALVYTLVEAIAMGAGEFLSDDAAHEVDQNLKGNPITSGVLMFFSYIAIAIIPIAPVLLLNFPASVAVSIVLALISLFIVGYIKGVVVGIKRSSSGFKIMIVGGLATLVGVVVGLAFKQ
jgi:VIT1/CCC1 family predicted Fe2+/Mn2+ transporter